MKPLLLFLLVSAALIGSTLKETGPQKITIETPIGFPEMPQNAQNPLTEEGIELGRKLFYDSILSGNKTFSCATCHRQEFAFSDGRTKGVGSNGDTLDRNVPGLFNLAWYSSLFWDGRSPSIEQQVFEPVRNHNELNLDWNVAVRRLREDRVYRNMFQDAFGTAKIDSQLVARAIAQFERTLVSSNSKFDRVLRGEEYLTASEYRGFVLMNDQTKGNCLHCHTTDADALGTTGALSNNGLQFYRKERGDDLGYGMITGDSLDFGRFKIPSLRNLVFTGPYMHDGRFETLEEVLDFYSEQVVFSAQTDHKMAVREKGGMRLSETEKADMINFLKALSDSSFILNQHFGPPQ